MNKKEELAKALSDLKLMGISSLIIKNETLKVGKPFVDKPAEYVQVDFYFEEE